MNTHDANLDTAAAAGMLFNLGELGTVQRCAEPHTPTGAAPRLRLAERQQGEFRLVVLDRFLPADHQVRVVW